MFGLLFSFMSSKAQTEILKNYIREGLENNLALQQKHDDYTRSLEVLNEARGKFFPSISFQARYTVAQGGRIIEFPVGDLLNPVYSTLNQMTGSSDFPVLENQEFSFYRPKEQETKIQVIQPIVNTQLIFNRKIQSALTETEKTDARVYEKYLIREIKTAYYNYLKALRLALLVDNTRVLLEENLRVNESLFSNDKVTADAVLRSQSELSLAEVKKAESEKMVRISAAYFNFLLNRPQDAVIIEDSLMIMDEWLFTESETTSQAVEKREELTMLKQLSTVADLNYRMNRTNRWPTLLGVAEFGFQGVDYNITDESDYLLASLVFSWNIFSGFQSNARIKQARIQKEMTEKHYDEVRSTIALEAARAWYDLQASRKSIEASGKQSETMKKAFDIIRKKYREGQSSLIEFLDARTTMTNADENLIINQFDYLIKMAELERVTGYDNTEEYNR
jgi:outer membrane protein TolC